MKKMCKLLLGLSALFTFTLTSCEATGGNNNKSGDTSVELSGFEKTGDVYKTKVNNDVQSFSFIDKVSVSSNSTWKLYSDISGTQEIVTKTISLNIGDNQSYVLVTAPNGDLGFYSVVVRRLDLYTVSFNTRGGSSIESQNVQEESLISPVANPTKTGYAFDKWDYDFTEPVMKDLTINASWVANSHTITFDVNGGNGNNTRNCATFCDGSSLKTRCTMLIMSSPCCS